MSEQQQMPNLSEYDIAAMNAIAANMKLLHPLIDEPPSQLNFIKVLNSMNLPLKQ